MTKLEAIAEAQRILGATAAPLTEADWDKAAEQAVLPDSEGRLPTDPGWVPTFCPWWLAAEAVATVQLRTQGQDRVISFTADGAQFTRKPADLAGLTASLRSRSPIAAIASQQPLGVIDVQGGVGYDPTSLGLL